jgi:hypothetical protein
MQPDQGLPFRGSRPVFRSSLYLRDLHPGPLGEIPDGFGERHFLVQLDELDDVAAGAAAETLEETLVLVDVERRSLLLVERTESLERGTCLLERHHVPDHADDVRLRFQVVQK